MAKRSFQEGKLQFTFNESWLVRKYDAHTFYQGFSGVGLKGVDFIAVRPGELLLIEVKNYRHIRNGRRRAAVAQVLEDPERIGRSIAQKGEDTLKAIRAIRTYYLRKWDYRWSAHFLKRFWWQWSDRSFWTQVAAQADVPDRISFLIWLATDPADAGLADIIRNEVVAGMDTIPGQILIADTVVPYDGVNVRWIL